MRFPLAGLDREMYGKLQSLSNNTQLCLIWFFEPRGALATLAIALFLAGLIRPLASNMKLVGDLDNSSQPGVWTMVS